MAAQPAKLTRAYPSYKRGAEVERAPKRLAKLRETNPGNKNAVTAAATDPNKPMTERQRAFVRLWAQGESIIGAAVKAGYKDNGAEAYKLRHDPRILAIYNDEKAKYEAASGMTRKRVIDGLLEAIDMAKLVTEPGSMVAGWREIAKMCGYYAPVEKKITVTDGPGGLIMDRLNRLSDAELLKLIQNDPNVIDVEATVVDGDDEEADDSEE